MYRFLKGYLIFAGVIILSGFFIYTRYISHELRGDAEALSRIYGKFAGRLPNLPDDEAAIIFDEIITKINFPVIVTRNPDSGVIQYRNVRDTTHKTIAKLDREYEPVKIEYNGKTLNYVHYGESRARRFLRLASVLQIAAALLLVIIGVIWLWVLKKSEEGFLWAGISKETAHQLGTPLSSLMGWLEHIEQKDLKPYLTKDIDRLSSITRRFQKIGSPPQLESEDPTKVMNETIEYLKDRLPQLGNNKVTIVENYSNLPNISIDKELFSWAIENLVKNSLDANAKHIELEAKSDKKFVKIRIKDDGKGIPRGFRRRIFHPGYSTKEYGWGLGLTFTKRIISMHQGKIMLEKNRKGKGTSFLISLPKKG